MSPADPTLGHAARTTPPATLADRIRSEAERPDTSADTRGPAPQVAGPRSAPDLDALAAGADFHRSALPSHRGVVGIPVTAVKRLLRRLLHQVLARQAEHNRAVVAALARLSERQDAERKEIDALQRWLARELRSVTDMELDYGSFAARFRGSEAVIGERQRAYVELFAGERTVVDLGCGRGEFLELLREQGTPARGVDLDPRLVEQCVARGLDVVAGEAVAKLSEIPDGTLGGVFSAHLIEHLTMANVVELVRVARNKLGPGGVLVLETPNPECLLTLAKFSLDPTHRQPIHPEFMRWLAEEEGFVDIAVIFSGVADDEPQVPPLRLPAGKNAGAIKAFNSGVEALNRRLYGARDYALTARRPIV